MDPKAVDALLASRQLLFTYDWNKYDAENV
jgi:hypothetical protein